MQTCYGTTELFAMQRTNDEWIAALRTQEPEACTEVFRMCCGVCYKQLSRTSFPEADPEQAAIDAMLKVFHAVLKPDFVCRASFTGFVFKVVNRHCIDIQRKLVRARARGVTIAMDETFEPPALEVFLGQHPDEPSIEEEQRKAALYDQLARCFARLPLRDQQILHYYYEHDLGPIAIASRLDPPITPNLVGVRRNRSINALKRCLEQAGVHA